MAEETETKASPASVPSQAQASAESDTKKGEKIETKETGTEAVIQQSVSFKEESNLVGDLPEIERKALDDLKQLIQSALVKNEFNPPPPPPPKSVESKPTEPPAVSNEPTAVDSAKTMEQVLKEPKSEGLTPESATKLEEPAATAKIEEPVADVKSVIVEEDGTKTVEAIKETVVPVAPAQSDSADSASVAVVDGAPTTDLAAPSAKEFIWGVPILGDEKSDTVLLKFLRARDFKVKDALAMIKNAVIWRKQFGIDTLLEEDLGLPELEKVVFYHGLDKESHPVCYNVYGEFQNQDLYTKVFGDEEKRKKFLRWRIQFLEKGIRQQLDFSPQGVCTMVQVTDLKNVPGPGRKELRQATKKGLALLQDNYPEFSAKQVFINVPWWYLAYNRVMSPFFTQRTKSKFVFAGPSKSAETLFRYITPEHVPVQYGGLSKENDSDFTTSDSVTEVIIKPSSKHVIELPLTETCLLVWELRVLGWDVSYGAEFIPIAEESYTVLVQKTRKLTAVDDAYLKNSFKVGEPGKIILSIDNTGAKKKKLLYRTKTKTNVESA